MKIFILMLSVLALSCNTSIYSQSKEQKEKLEKIKDQYSFDDNNNLLYVKVIDDLNLNKDELFNRALSYFTYNYTSASDVINIKDKEAGTIVGKGYFKTFYCTTQMLVIGTDFSAYHILRVDIKNNKIRVILTVSEYDVRTSGGNVPDINNKIDIYNTAPFNKKGVQKKLFTNAFLALHRRCLLTLYSFEKSIKEGNTSSELENSDW